MDNKLVDPYAVVDFETALYVQSFCHEHKSNTPQHLYDQGFRHFNYTDYATNPPGYDLDGVPHDDVTNPRSFPEDYYGCAPMYPIRRWYPDFWAAHGSEIIETPGAEQWTPNVLGVNGILGHMPTIGCLASTIGHNYQHFGIEDGTGGGRIWVGDRETGEAVLVGNSRLEMFEYFRNGMMENGCTYLAHSDINITQMIKDAAGLYTGKSMYNDARDYTDQRIPNTGYHILSNDNILMDRTICWLYGESDRGQRVCNILLLPEFTAEAALKAYRDGAFYVKMERGEAPAGRTTLKFKKIKDYGTYLEVETEGAVSGIKIIGDRKVVAESSPSNPNYLKYDYPMNGNNVTLRYLRVEAYAGVFDEVANADLDYRYWPVLHYRDTDARYIDEIYSQPIIFSPYVPISGGGISKKAYALGAI